MFLEFTYWFTNCIAFKEGGVTTLETMLNSFTQFSGDSISIQLLKDYLRIYNVEFDDEKAIGVIVYD